MNRTRNIMILSLSLLAVITADSAKANIRRFTYTYESAVLPPGAFELEPWITWRAGRNGFYSRFDNRLEYEIGVTSRLMTALYLNWKRETIKDPVTKELSSISEFEGFSSEWKYKIFDPAADTFGLAVYGEIGVNTDEAEFELKMIVDKVTGNIVLAYNFILEPELEYEAGELEFEEFSIDHTAGISYAFSPRCSMGMEIWQHTHTQAGTVLHSTVFAGPVFSYVAGEFWVTLTVLGQLPAIKTAQPGADFVLDSHEQFNTRLLMALPL